MRPYPVLLILISGIAALVGGCTGDKTSKNSLPSGVTATLRNADRFELLSLDPGPLGAENYKEGDDPDRFHGWRILGRTDVTDREERRKLIDSLLQGIADAENIVPPSHFSPGHGIHVSRGLDEIDLVISFNCAQIQIGEGDSLSMVKTATSPQIDFDKLLSDAGVPLAPKPVLPKPN